MDPVLGQSDINLSERIISPELRESSGVYIRTLAELEAAKCAPPCSEVGKFIEDRYGIIDFDGIVERHFPSVRGHHSALLPRQIMTPCTETIATILLCEVLNLSPLLGSFTTDTFSHGSVDKSAAVKVKSIAWRQTAAGNIICEPTTTRLTIEPLEALSGSVIDSLQTDSTETVVEYHRKRLTYILGKDLVHDCSEFFSEILKSAKNKPDYCYVRNDHQKSIRVPTSEIDLASICPRNVRPPASWYYPIMFSLFVDKLFLLETYENPRGNVSEAKELFSHTSNEILSATGRRPRVIEIPPLSKEMLFHNSHIINDGGLAMARLSLKCREIRDTNGPLDLANKIAELVLGYGKQQFSPHST